MHCSPFIYSSLFMICQAVVVWLTDLKSFLPLTQTWSEWCCGVVILSHILPPSSQESSVLPNLNCKHDKCFFPQTQWAVPTVCFGCCKSNKLIWHMVSRRPEFEGNMGKLLEEQKSSAGERVWCPFFCWQCAFFLLLVHNRLVQTQST